MISMNIEQRLRALEDKAALKTLVDRFSNLADEKDVEAQVMLFAEDATVDSYIDGTLVSSLKGRSEILHAFHDYLAMFETVYHLNGQRTVEVIGDSATGISYCLVTLIAAEGASAIRSTSGIIYSDTCVHNGDEWLIAGRVSHFLWRDREPMG